MTERVADPENMLGTLGHGNHFAEFLAVEKVIDEEKCGALNIKKSDVLLLIHAGSRCYGEMLWREVAAKHGDKGLEFGEYGKTGRRFPASDLLHSLSP